MKIATGVEKPLAEWTLKEAQKICANYWKKNCDCANCPLHDTDICRSAPVGWDLKEKKKFTENEISYCKALLFLFDGGEIRRDSSSAVYFRYEGNNMRIYRFFPSIHCGESYNIKEIIGDYDA